MRLHVRGQMGVQILQSAVALADCSETEEPILCVNHGNLSNASTNKLDLLFDPACRIIDIDTTYKTPYWVEGAATKVFTNRKKILHWLRPKDLSSIFPHDSAIHIRGNDKKIASVDSLKYLLTFAPLNAIIFTDDVPYASRVCSTREIVSRDSYSDWIDMYNAKQLYAAPSSFILSMLIFNPDKKITFLGRRHCDGEYTNHGDLVFMYEAQEFCRNLEIIG